MTRKNLAIVSGLVAFAVFLRLPTFLKPLLEVDEAIYAAIANLMLDGGVLYDRGGVDHKPPVIYFIYALAFLVGGRNNMLLVQFFNLLSVLATAWFLFRIAALTWSAEHPGTEIRASYWAPLLFFAFTSAFYFENLSANAEVFMNLFLTLGHLLLLRTLVGETRQGWLAMAAAGLFVALAALTKQVSGVSFLALFGFLLWRRQPARVVLAFVAGAALPLLAFSAYFALRGAHHTYVFWTYLEPWLYVAGREGLGWVVLQRALVNSFCFVGSSLLVWVLAALFLRREVGAVTLAHRREGVSGQGGGDSGDRGGGRGGSRDPVIVLVLWLSVTIIPVTTGGRFIFHYYLLFLPPLCIFAALFLESLQREGRFVGWPRRLILFWMFLPCLTYFVIFFFHKQMEAKFNKVRNYEQVGAYLAAHTKGHQRLFVWGFASDVYYHADRLAATRYVFTDQIAGLLSGFGRAVTGHTDPDAIGNLERDFEAVGYPVYIVDTSPCRIYGYEKFPIQGVPYLRTLLARRYQLERTLGCFPLYRLRSDG